MGFSEDEIFAFAVHLIVALFTWTRWIMAVWAKPMLGRTSAMRWPLWCAPFVAMSVVMSLLGSFAASDVRGTIYIGFYAVIGLAWIGMGSLLFSIIGPSPRDDVIERRNNPAGVTLLGAVFGFSFAFAGGNFGDGPGWWVVLICSVLSMGTLLLLWILQSRAHQRRDHHRARRADRCPHRVLLMACGGILGRSVAGGGSISATPVSVFSLCLAGFAHCARGFWHHPRPRAGQTRPPPVAARCSSRAAPRHCIPLNRGRLHRHPRVVVYAARQPRPTASRPVACRPAARSAHDGQPPPRPRTHRV